MGRYWKVEIDNRIRCYGDCNHHSKTIRINNRLHVRDRESLPDTLVHEFLHLKYPNKSEAEIEALAHSYELPRKEWEFIATLYVEALKRWQNSHRSKARRDK